MQHGQQVEETDRWPNDIFTMPATILKAGQCPRSLAASATFSSYRCSGVLGILNFQFRAPISDGVIPVVLAFGKLVNRNIVAVSLGLIESVKV